MGRAHKVILATSEFPPLPGGIGNHAFNLAKYLNLQNFNVDVITNMRANFDHEKEFLESQLPGVEIYLIRRKLPAVRTYLHRLDVLKELLKKAGPKATLILSGKFWIMAAGLIKIPSNIKVIGIIHGTEISGQKLLFRRGLNRCYKLICVSSYTQKKLHEAYPFTKEASDIINNGFDLNINEKSNIKQEPSEHLNLVTVGNVHPRKGQDNVIRMIPELIKIFPNLRYNIIGIPTHKKEFEQLASELGVKEHVLFHGRVEIEDLKQKVEENDIFVMLSKELKNGDFEGFGIAILEANSLGLPAIGSINSGIEDAIQSGKNGLLINSTNAQQLIEAIETIRDDYEGFSERALRWADQFHWKNVIHRYIDLLNE